MAATYLLNNALRWPEMLKCFMYICQTQRQQENSSEHEVLSFFATALHLGAKTVPRSAA